MVPPPPVGAGVDPPVVVGADVPVLGSHLIPVVAQLPVCPTGLTATKVPVATEPLT
jgi:hypothetical protein